MNFRTNTLAAALAISLFAGCASYPAGAAMPARMEGGILTGAGGMTLYTFDKDAAGSGKSVCNGSCAGNWPPLSASETDRASGEWSIVMRDDGRRQWAFRGKPLYFWSKDQKAGDKTGDGFNNAWHVVR